MNPTDPRMSRQKPTMLCIAPILLSIMLAASAALPALAVDTIVIAGNDQSSADDVPCK